MSKSKLEEERRAAAAKAAKELEILALRDDANARVLAQKRAEQAAIKKQVMTHKSEQSDVESQEAWEKVLHNAKELMIKGMEGYNEWSTAMMNLVNVNRDLSAAIHISLNGEPLERIPAEMGEFLKEGGNKLINSISEKAQQKGWIKDQMSPAIFNIDLDENGSLVDTNVSYGGEAFDQDLQQMFKAGVIAWASTRGYDLDKTAKPPVLKHHETKQPLTPEVFKSINKDDEHSLKSFLSNRFKMDMAPSPSPKP